MPTGRVQKDHNSVLWSLLKVILQKLLRWLGYKLLVGINMVYFHWKVSYWTLEMLQNIKF